MASIYPVRHCYMKMSIFVSVYICILVHMLQGHAYGHVNAEIKTRLESKEPVCYSRFDYDFKILRTMASLEESDAQLTGTTRNLQNEVDGIKSSIKASPSTIAFMAHLPTNINIQPIGPSHQPIVFDDIITNLGGGFNKYTGGFIAPIDGVYHFNLEISIPNGVPGQVLHIVLEKNGERAGYIFFVVDEHLWLRKTTAVTHYLARGDTMQPVVVLSQGSSSNVIGGASYHSHFSGFLVGQ